MIDEFSKENEFSNGSSEFSKDSYSEFYRNRDKQNKKQDNNSNLKKKLRQLLLIPVAAVAIVATTGGAEKELDYIELSQETKDVLNQAIEYLEEDNYDATQDLFIDNPQVIQELSKVQDFVDDEGNYVGSYIGYDGNEAFIYHGSNEWHGIFIPSVNSSDVIEFYEGDIGLKNGHGTIRSCWFCGGLWYRVSKAEVRDGKVDSSVKTTCVNDLYDHLIEIEWMMDDDSLLSEIINLEVDGAIISPKQVEIKNFYDRESRYTYMNSVHSGKYPIYIFNVAYEEDNYQIYEAAITGDGLDGDYGLGFRNYNEGIW